MSYPLQHLMSKMRLCEQPCAVTTGDTGSDSRSYDELRPCQSWLLFALQVCAARLKRAQRATWLTRLQSADGPPVAIMMLSLTRTTAPVRFAQPSIVRVVAPSRGSLVVQNAHKKGTGAVKNGRDSKSKSRGVKVFGGQPVTPGGIIVRQLGNKVCVSAAVSLCFCHLHAGSKVR